MKKACVVQFLGSNCDNEAVKALSDCGLEVKKIFYKDGFEVNYKPDLVFIPGGFSYGDYLRSGALASRMRIMEDVKKFADEGRFVIGICNGFQILTEARLLDGALLRNAGGRFICKNIKIQAINQKSIFTNDLDKINIQIAHADGRYFADDDVLKKLEDEDRIAFKYLQNPNGSLADIAGILGGKNHNILGMMPHPERVIMGGSGMEIFKNLLK
jgi:phosphoribosylformylglycinamidine synthase